MINRRFIRASCYCLTLIFFKTGLTQTLPVGTPLLEEVWRRQQIAGERDSNRSFMIRPLNALDDEEFDSLYHPLALGASENKNSFSFAKGKGKLRILPVTFQQQYNSHHPYGWNDGSMIQARGYQNQFSAGVFAKIGPLSIQLRPEFVYANNKNFGTFPSSYSDSIWANYYVFLNTIDNPEKYGTRSYAKVFAGQSSVKFNFKKLALGVSTENLWWGPGIRNSLLMSNNAPGFVHLTFNSTAPVLSPIGSFEWQLIAGKLKGSGILPPDTGRLFDGNRLYTPKPEDDRYINGMVLVWQPKWTKGLFVGFSRVFYMYDSDVPASFDGYLPVLGAFFKGQLDNEDAKKRDQMISFFMRLALPKEKAEVYAEFGRNDHSQNLRDFILEPEHSRAYIIGLRKLFSRKANKDLELMMEFANLENTSTALLRERPIWYNHYQVLHGYTQRGQVIGAGIGPGSNSQTIGLNWINKLKKTGFFIERITRNNDFYYMAFASSGNFGSHWVDVSVNANHSWVSNRLIYSANLSLVRSLNYQWRHEFDTQGASINRNSTNIFAGLSVSYVF